MNTRLVLVLSFLFLCSIQFSSCFEWNQAIGKQFVYYSYAAYCPSNQVKAWDCKWCQEASIKDFEVTAQPYDFLISGSGYVGVHHTNKTIVVCFRGTDDIRNWVIDLLSAKKVPYKNVPGAEVGDGFYDEYKDLSSSVLTAVSNLRSQYPTYPIWVTGHSLGAAISVLCAVDLVEQGYDNVNVYNYGLPRVGNQDFANYYNSKVPNTFRVVNGHDIVPHVPLLDMGFHHVSTEVWENPAESLSFKVCDGSGEDKSCSDSNTFDLSVYDHLHYFNIEESCS
eukprot:TRINITY_DN873_c0_g1_i1.p1 TRINITY_DN873_c0_g1~~TRINITY_DN873_c0_g1_i1.p1  ORF type:complete len:280 (-),score=89.71 TRINITY_DN873_c0_g1_i1:173-1012(-)